jgi:hypothetical protein
MYRRLAPDPARLGESEGTKWWTGRATSAPREPVADDAAGFRFQMAPCALVQYSITDCFHFNTGDRGGG